MQKPGRVVGVQESTRSSQSRNVILPSDDLLKKEEEKAISKAQIGASHLARPDRIWTKNGALF